MEDRELKHILDEQTELMKDSNEMLHKMRRAQVLGSVFSVIKWTLILGSAFGLYYYFQPAILRVFEAYDKLLIDSQGVQEFLAKFRQ